MSLQVIARLEELVDQLLTERSKLQTRNQELTAANDRLIEDRCRVSAELDKLLDKLESLEGKGQ